MQVNFNTYPVIGSLADTDTLIGMSSLGVVSGYITLLDVKNFYTSVASNVTIQTNFLHINPNTGNGKLVSGYQLINYLFGDTFKVLDTDTFAVKSGSAYKVATGAQLKTYVGSGTYVPTSATGLVAWYDFSDKSSMILGGDGLIAQVNDKSGNGYNLVQATGANKPLLDTSGRLPFGHFVSGNFIKNTSVSCSQPYTLYLVTRQLSPGSNQRGIVKTGTGYDGINQMNIGGSAPYDYLGVAAGASFNLQQNSNLWTSYFDIQKFVVNGANTKGGAGKGPYNLTDYTGPGSNAVSRLSIGDDTNPGASFDIYALILLSNEASAADDKNIRNYLAAKYAIPYVDFIASVGDSGMSAYPVGQYNSWINQTARARNMKVYNHAIAGYTMSGAIGVQDQGLLQSYAPNNSGWLVLCLGANDDYTITTPTAWKATYKAWIQSFITIGWAKAKIVLSNPWYASSRTWYGGTTGLLAITAQIASELGIIFLDLNAYTLANGGDSLLNSDGIHPLQTGQDTMSNLLKTIIQ